MRLEMRPVQRRSGLCRLNVKRGEMTQSAQLTRTGLMGLVAVLMVFLAAKAHDTGFAIHAWIGFAAAAAYIVYVARSFPNGATNVPDTSGYFDGVIRAGAIATVFWGIAGFLVGVVIAFQLAYPALN